MTRWVVGKNLVPEVRTRRATPVAEVWRLLIPVVVCLNGVTAQADHVRGQGEEEQSEKRDLQVTCLEASSVRRRSSGGGAFVVGKEAEQVHLSVFSPSTPLLSR